MKKSIALLLGLSFVVCLTAVAEPSAADQKWMAVAQKKIAKGETKISTPSQARVTLLKEWAAKKGWRIEVTKTESGYRLERSQSIVQR